MDTLKDYTMLSDYCIDNRLNFNVSYNKLRDLIKTNKIDFKKIHSKLYLYNINDLNRILLKK